jgi:hypothetical protein
MPVTGDLRWWWSMYEGERGKSDKENVGGKSDMTLIR